MNIVNFRIKISSDFSTTPGPRFMDEGECSGELLRKKILLPAIADAIKSKNKLIIDLDGTHGYLTSFLEEAFGGLIREDGISLDNLNQTLELVSNEEPYLIEDINDYLQEANSET